MWLKIIIFIFTLIPPIFFMVFDLLGRHNFDLDIFVANITTNIIVGEIVQSLLTYIYPTIVISLFFYTLINLFSKNKEWLLYPTKLGIFASFIPLVALIFAGILAQWEWCCLSSSYKQDFPMNVVLNFLGLLINFGIYAFIVALISAKEARERKFLSGLISGVLVLALVFIVSEIAAVFFYLGNLEDWATSPLLKKEQSLASLVLAPWDKQSVVAFIASPLLYYLRFLLDLLQLIAIVIGAGLGTLIKRNTAQPT